MSTALAQIEQQTTALQVEANAIVVRDAMSQDTAWEFCKRLKTLLAQIDEAFDELIANAHAMHKDAIAKKKSYANVPETCMRSVNAKIAVYQAELRRHAAAAQERLTAVARRDEEDRRLAAAVELEAQGRSAEANALIEAPVAPVCVQVAPPPKPEGMKSRTVWKFQLFDAALLPREYMIPDEVRIGQVVRAMKGVTNIPGVRPYPEESLF